MNVFTWPEILRQLALSAGLGPELKKQDIKTMSVHDENEVGKYIFYQFFSNVICGFCLPYFLSSVGQQL